MEQLPRPPRFQPSEHQAQREQKEKGAAESKSQTEKSDTRLRRAVEALLKTDDGRIFWAEIFRRCGWNGPILFRLVGGDVAALSTEAAAAQREVYRDLRRLAPRELLVRAEEFAEFGQAEIDDKKGA